MIYLDYSATTPVNDDVLDTFVKVNKNYIGNPNSLHKLGLESKRLIDASTKQIAKLLNIDIYNFNLMTIAQYCFIVLYLTFIILICGIDKENKNVDKLVSIYGIVISILYMVYLLF